MCILPRSPQGEWATGQVQSTERNNAQVYAALPCFAQSVSLLCAGYCCFKRFLCQGLCAFLCLCLGVKTSAEPTEPTWPTFSQLLIFASVSVLASYFSRANTTVQMVSFTCAFSDLPPLPPMSSWCAPSVHDVYGLPPFSVLFPRVVWGGFFVLTRAMHSCIGSHVLHTHNMSETYMGSCVQYNLA